MTIRKLMLSAILLLLAAGTALADVGAYVDDINIFAGKRFGEFKADVSARYGISGSRFDVMLKKVDSPGDLAVALWLGSKAYQPVDEVVKHYRIHRGKGWGVVARELGIKPGSPAFQQLKKGDLGWYPKNFDAVMKEHRKEKVEQAKEKKEKRRKGY